MDDADRGDDAGDVDEEPAAPPTQPGRGERAGGAEGDGPDGAGSDGSGRPAGARDHPEPEDDDVASEADRRLDRDLQALREDLSELEEEVEERTVHRADVEGDLRRYVRKRVRRGKARGWGPYLVLLYGTAMTLGAFYYLSGGWAILAMFVVWLSTLGLYTFMVVTGILFTVFGLPGRALDAVRSFRS